MDPISSYPPIPSTATTSSIDDTNGKNGVAERVREKLDGAAHTVSDVASRAKQGARDVAGRVQERASDATRSSREMVIGHPLRSMGAALGVGVILGMLLARSMR
jgi:ElaB/YqjD/DUF883 family membrane-anchored ribosome-binding protein